MDRDAGKSPVRVMIVDDHEGLRTELRRLLGGCSWIALTRAAASAEEALELLADERPDIVLMDISLPGMNGIDATREVVRNSPAKVIGLSMHQRAAYAAGMREAGAMELLVKGGSVQQILRAIELVSAGECLLCPDASGERRDHVRNA